MIFCILSAVYNSHKWFCSVSLSLLYFCSSCFLWLHIISLRFVHSTCYCRNSFMYKLNRNLQKNLSSYATIRNTNALIQTTNAPCSSMGDGQQLLNCDNLVSGKRFLIYSSLSPVPILSSAFASFYAFFLSLCCCVSVSVLVLNDSCCCSAMAWEPFAPPRCPSLCASWSNGRVRAAYAVWPSTAMHWWSLYCKNLVLKKWVSFLYLQMVVF